MRSRRSTSAASARSRAEATSTGIRPPGRCRRARRRSARYFRHLPDALERAAELDARVRAQSRPRQDADVRRRVLVQGSVRHEGHALDRRRRCRLRHRFPGARSHPRRAAAQQGRDHLRQGGEHRIQRPGRRSGRAAHAREGAALDARLSAQHVGRQSVEPVRHDALGLARLELRLRRVGQRQFCDGEPRRRDARVLPRAVQSQFGRAASCRTRRCSASTAAPSAPTSIATAAASTAARSRTARKCSTR